MKKWIENKGTTRNCPQNIIGKTVEIDFEISKVIVDSPEDLDWLISEENVKNLDIIRYRVIG